MQPVAYFRRQKNHPGGGELVQLMEAVAAAAPSDRPRIAGLQTGAVGAAESSERGGVSISNIPQDSQGQKASA